MYFYIHSFPPVAGQTPHPDALLRIQHGFLQAKKVALLNVDRVLCCTLLGPWQIYAAFEEMQQTRTFVRMRFNEATGQTDPVLAEVGPTSPHTDDLRPSANLVRNCR